jgi:transposase
VEPHVAQSHKRKEPVVKRNITRWVGLDVHAETIVAAVAERDGEVRSLGVHPNSSVGLRRLVKRFGEGTAYCYEAGPTGYATYWALEQLGAPCMVVAPTLIPRRPGDRIKTDRRDAEKLARAFRAGDLTAVWVPDHAHEALRDLVRCREAAKQDQLRARHRLSKLLLRRGLRPPKKTRNWGFEHTVWVQGLRFDEPALEATRVDLWTQVQHQTARIAQLDKAIDEAVERAATTMREVISALQALRGVAKTTAATVVAELGQLSRFSSPRELMAYAGIVPSEYSSGQRTWRGSITRTGNARLRRVVVESAWSYRYPPNLFRTLKKRQEGLDEEVKGIAWKAQHRLHQRYRALMGRGKNSNQTVTAVARELLGFIWAIGCHMEKQHPNIQLKHAA